MEERKLIARPECPVCGSTEGKLFLKRNLDWRKLDGFAFASRKKPEHMNLNLIRCGKCGVVRTSEKLENGILLDAYREADYDSDAEAEFAAGTYAGLIREVLPERRESAIDVGCGNGALLPELEKMGFRNVVGYEPSGAARNAAKPEIVEKIVNGIFEDASVPDSSADLIFIGQTLEHLENPLGLLQLAFRKLRTGGVCAVADHNIDAMVNRILGKHSPVIDVEHLQIFNERSLSEILERAGFRLRTNRTYRNRYPLSYYIHLLPIRTGGKGKKFLRRIPLSLPLGNRFAAGIREESFQKKTYRGFF